MTLNEQFALLKKQHDEEGVVNHSLLVRVLESVIIALDEHQTRMNGFGETVLRIEEKIGKLPEKVPYTDPRGL